MCPTVRWGWGTHHLSTPRRQGGELPEEGDAKTLSPLASYDERQYTAVHSRALLASGLGGLVVGAGVLWSVYSGGGTERPHFFKLVRYEPFAPFT